MRRLLLLAILGSGLVWAGLASAAEPYTVDIDTTGRRIYVYPSTAMPTDGDAETLRNFPPSTTLTVTVVDQAGKPVAGVPVAFAVAPGSTLEGMVQFEPKQGATGPNGTVQTTVGSTSSATTGAGKVMVQAGNVTETVGLSIYRSPQRARN